MLLLVEIDLQNADLPLFEEYESKVLALLDLHGARMAMRLRSVDGNKEVHLLSFPDDGALEAFRADPARIEAQPLWVRCGATARMAEFVRVS